MLSDFGSDLTKWLVEFALQQAIEKTPLLLREIKRRWPSQSSGGRSFQSLRVSRVGLVDREKECRAIREAIKDVPHTHILWFHGPRGVGKTRLLEEASLITKSLPAFLHIRWAGALDLYHVDYHSIPHLQTAIVRALDPRQHFFERFWRAKAQYEHHREAGFREDLNGDRLVLDAAFREDYRVFAQNVRPVIAFDTFERINDERDLFQKLAGDEPLSLGKWLLDFCQSAPNSIFLLAGRSRPELSKASERIEFIPVEGFTRVDSSALLGSFLKKQPAYLQALRERASLDKLLQLTGGIPVELALAVELFSRGCLLVEQLQSDNSLTEKILVDSFFDYEVPQNRPVFFLALARKGLTADLLHYLEPSWPPEQCQQSLGKLASTSLVKSRREGKELFLHDALYDLFDQYFDGDKLKPWYECFREYYQEREVECLSDREAWGETILKSFYYALREDAFQAFQSYYLEKSEAALAGYEFDLDMRLRDELLWYLRSASGSQTSPALVEQAELDSAVRWVKRYRNPC